MSSQVAAAFVTACVGGLIALQAPINSHLGKTTGTFAAALISFGIGTAILLTIVIVTGNVGDLSGVGDVRAQYLLGGALGAAYVTTVLLTVRTLGAGGVTAATVAGQLTTAVLIDRLGILGLEKTPITVARIIGVLLLFAGTVLVIRT
jgi:bacterial/archaeal transporter family-2 protein